MEPIAIKIEFWTLPDGSLTGEQPEGIDEFRAELTSSYASFVRGRSGACGGGLYEFVVNITTSITFHDVVNLILGGVAYDLIKSSTGSFVLRPLIEAFEKLKSRNQERDLDIGEIRIAFQDADIVITKTGLRPIFDDLGGIFKALSENFDSMKGQTGERPYLVTIPVFEDPEARFCRFRCLLNVDETIRGVNSDSYFKFWGVRYNLEAQIRVFDVQHRLLIDERYLTQSEYWTMWEIKWEEEWAMKCAAEKQGISPNAKGQSE